MATLETSNRGDSSSVTIEVVEDHGDRVVIKRPVVPMDPLAERAFGYFVGRLDHYPFLQQHFPPTKIVHDETGAYYVQHLVQTNPGQTNMASPTNPALFDLEQIRTPEDLSDILQIVKSGFDFFRSSIYDPRSGTDPFEGFLPEVHKPGSYVRGRLKDGSDESIFFLDCQPFIPIDEVNAEILMKNCQDALGEIACDKFGISLEDVLPDGSR